MPFSRPEDLQSTFAKAMQAKDLEALLALYEPDAIVALPDGTQLTDAAARRDMMTGLVEADTSMQSTQRKVLIAGDLALTSSAYEVNSGEAGKAPDIIQSAEVSRRQPDGTWRVVIDAPTFS